MKFLTIKEVLENYQKAPVFYDACDNADSEKEEYLCVVNQITNSAKVYGLSEKERLEAEGKALSIFEERNKKIKELKSYFDLLGEPLKESYIKMCENKDSAAYVLKIIKAINPKDMQGDYLAFAVVCDNFVGIYQRAIANLVALTIREKIEQHKMILERDEGKVEEKSLFGKKKQGYVDFSDTERE